MFFCTVNVESFSIAVYNKGPGHFDIISSSTFSEVIVSNTPSLFIKEKYLYMFDYIDYKLKGVDEGRKVATKKIQTRNK